MKLILGMQCLCSLMWVQFRWHLLDSLVLQ